METSNKKFLVIGDICTDVYVTCKVERLCPEGPVPVAVPILSKSNGGMALNVLANLNALSGLDISLAAPETVKNIKTRYVDTSGHLMLRVDTGDKCTERFVQDSLNSMDLRQFSACIISDYDKGFLSAGDISFIARKCKEANCTTWLDTKKILGSFTYDIDFVKINKKEYDYNISAGVNPIGCCNCLIWTDGANGANLELNGTRNYPSPQVKVSDVSGAGDTFIAAAAFALAHTNSIEKAIIFANVASAIAVSKPGVVTVTPGEIIRSGLWPAQPNGNLF